ncbi:MAG: hypothetical protein JAY74_10490 [Candidatus Thiodiazotropha taylori]|nr:hypothetical protein [Candidatus Thiodiazotropha taylori]
MQENTKWVIGTVIALIAAGGGAAKWLGIFKPSPEISLVGKWKPEAEGDIGCSNVVIHKDEDGSIEGNCDNPAYKHNIKGTYSDSQHIKVVVTRLSLKSNCTTKAKGSYKVINENTLEYYQEGWDGCNAKGLGAGSFKLHRG